MGFTENLQAILKARYGKDVRQSIHDGIKECKDTVDAGLEEYEKRTLNRFMKKLTVPGEKCNLKMRMNLRYACFKFLGM